MAAGGPTVTLIFAGDASKLKRTLNEVGAGTLGFLGKIGKVGGAASGFLGMANSVMTLGSAVTTVAPAALALPGILLGAGVAAGTAKLALAGFGDAVGGDAEALAKFAPAGQDAVRAVQGLGSGFAKMRKDVQADFFAGLAPEITATGDSLLGLGQTALPEVASGFNLMAVNALRAMRTPFFNDSLAGIVGNTSGAIFNMSGVAANALTGLVGLGAAGATYLPAIGTAVDGVAAKFAAWVQAKGTEGITAMIDKALAGFRMIWSILTLIGQTAGAVWSGIQQGLGASATPLDMLAQKAQMFLTIMQSPTAQVALAQLGTAIRAISDAFLAVMPHLMGFAFTIAGVVLPAITGLAQFVGANAAIFGPLIGAVLLFVGAARVLAPIISLVTGAIRMWSIAQGILNAVMALNPIGLVVIAIGLLVAALIYAWNTSETFRNAVMAVWNAVKTSVKIAVDAVKGHIDFLIAGFNRAKAIIPGIFAAIGNAISAPFRAAFNGIRSLWNSTVGGWGFSIPSWVPGLGGMSFRIPTMHTGGVVPGAPGSETLALLEAGERVIPAGASGGGGGGGRTVHFTGNTSDALATVIMGLIRTGKIQIG